MVQPSQFGYFYYATWNDNNIKLKSSTTQKLVDIALSFFRGLANKLVLPSTKKATETLHNNFLTSYQAKFQSIPLEITSADGAKIRGTLLNKIDTSLGGHCVIFFQPEGKIYDEDYFQSLINEIESDGKACNFIVFDHRGSGRSEQCTPTPAQLLLDADSIYQFVRDGLGVSEDHISMIGSGFGAAIAAQVKAMHKQSTGPLTLDRTFSSPIQAIYHYLGGGLIARIAAFALKLFNWQIINTLNALERIQSKVQIVYSPHDKEKEQAHLHTRIRKKDNISLLSLDYSLLKKNVHQHDIRFFVEESMKAADITVAEFLTQDLEVDLDAWQNRIDTFKDYNEALRVPFYEYVAKSYYADQIDNERLSLPDIQAKGYNAFHEFDTDLQLEDKILMLKDLYSGRVALAGYRPKPSHTL